MCRMPPLRTIASQPLGRVSHARCVRSPCTTQWPGGIRQQFKAIQPLVEGMLRTLKQVGETSVRSRGGGGPAGREEASPQPPGSRDKPQRPVRRSSPRRVQVDGLQGALTPELWDDGDAVGAW